MKGAKVSDEKRALAAITGAGCWLAISSPAGSPADASAALIGAQTATVQPGVAAPLTDSGFDTSVPEDLTPETAAAANYAVQTGLGYGQAQALPTATAQPTLENAAANMTDPTAIQQQIMQNQMGIG